jgi:hypothetical protein
MATTTKPPVTGGPRVQLGVRTLRKDKWWLQPAITAAVLTAFIAYSSFRAFYGHDYYAAPYLSPFFSPCLSASCAPAPHLSLLPTVWVITPAIYILIFPLGFRLTCYYYRKAYYRAFWQSPPACAVSETHSKYTGETRFPLIMQNIHRYFWYAGLVFNVILTWDALVAFNFNGHFGIGVGTIVMVINAISLWAYSVSCHSCRHLVGGRLKHFSKHPVRYKAWTAVSRLNARHQQLAWFSLLFVAFTDLYVWLVASGTITDLHWIS